MKESINMINAVSLYDKSPLGKFNLGDSWFVLMSQ